MQLTCLVAGEFWEGEQVTMQIEVAEQDDVGEVMGRPRVIQVGVVMMLENGQQTFSELEEEEDCLFLMTALMPQGISGPGLVVEVE
jgi:hypothetical protein